MHLRAPGNPEAPSPPAHDFLVPLVYVAMCADDLPCFAFIQLARRKGRTECIGTDPGPRQESYPHCPSVAGGLSAQHPLWVIEGEQVHGRVSERSRMDGFPDAADAR